MCKHPDSRKRLVERARDDDGITEEGEQLLRCRECGSIEIKHKPKNAVVFPGRR